MFVNRSSSIMTLILTQTLASLHRQSVWQQSQLQHRGHRAAPAKAPSTSCAGDLLRRAISKHVCPTRKCLLLSRSEMTVKLRTSRRRFKAKGMRIGRWLRFSRHGECLCMRVRIMKMVVDEKGLAHEVYPAPGVLNESLCMPVSVV